jgi:hypothetical protein
MAPESEVAGARASESVRGTSGKARSTVVGTESTASIESVATAGAGWLAEPWTAKAVDGVGAWAAWAVVTIAGENAGPAIMTAPGALSGLTADVMGVDR